jgi:hypothetical protein
MFNNLRIARKIDCGIGLLVGVAMTSAALDIDVLSTYTAKVDEMQLASGRPTLS